MAGSAAQWWSWEIAAGMAGTLGEVSLAGHAVLQNIGFFLFPLFFGTSVGATVRARTTAACEALPGFGCCLVWITTACRSPTA